MIETENKVYARRCESHVEALRRAVPGCIENVEWQCEDQLTITVKQDKLPEAVHYLYYERYGWIPVIVGNDERSLCGRYAVYYVISMEGEDPGWVTVRTEVDPAMMSFSSVTPLTEVGLLPIGSRPAKRGLGAKSLDDLRTIPWIFSWSQARINLAAWYGLGTACEQFGDLDQLKAAYQEWPFFRTFIDNIEMSIAKTDQRIAKMYLHLGDRQELSEKVCTEMQLTRKWVLASVGDEWPLQRRRPSWRRTCPSREHRRSWRQRPRSPCDVHRYFWTGRAVRQAR